MELSIAVTLFEEGHTYVLHCKKCGVFNIRLFISSKKQFYVKNIALLLSVMQFQCIPEMPSL